MKLSGFHVVTALVLVSLRVATLHAADEGGLSVATNPEGIEVWIDDKYIGDSPIVNKRMKSGRYSLKLIDPIQHTSIEEEVLIQGGKDIQIEKTMKGKYGTLKITSDPEGANVYLLTSLGKTPVSNEFMNPGKYRLEIRHPSKRYATMTDDVVIPRGEVVNLSKTLEKASPLDLKALVRLGLGAGAVVSFVWAIVEQGNKKSYDTKADPTVNPVVVSNQTRKKEYLDAAHSAAVKRTVGIVLGSACVVGFEIVAFF